MALEERDRFNYMLLGRLLWDCQAYLDIWEDYGVRNPKRLWALDEKKQIEKMKELYEAVPVKPEWLTMEQIETYAKKMGEIENVN